MLHPTILRDLLYLATLHLTIRCTMPVDITTDYPLCSFSRYYNRLSALICTAILQTTIWCALLYLALLQPSALICMTILQTTICRNENMVSFKPLFREQYTYPVSGRVHGIMSVLNWFNFPGVKIAWELPHQGKRGNILDFRMATMVPAQYLMRCYSGSLFSMQADSLQTNTDILDNGSGSLHGSILYSSSCEYFMSFSRCYCDCGRILMLMKMLLLPTSLFLLLVW
jgi:hypothetical protein